MNLSAVGKYIIAALISVLSIAEVYGQKPVFLGVSVVTGQFTPQSVTNSLYDVKVIGSEKIEQKGATDINTLLDTETGIRLSNDAMLGETDLEITGMGGNNVKVLVDGVPMVERGAIRQSLGQMDIGSIERVEIVEGPMSVIYGSDALAGVINIITRKPAPGFTVSGGVHEESMGSEYSFIRGNGIHRQSVNVGWAGEKGLFLDGGLSRYDAGGWQGDKTGREKAWQPKSQYLWSGTAGVRRNGFTAWYRLDYADEKISTPHNAPPTLPDQIFDVDFLTARFTHRLHADLRLRDDLRLNLATSYQDYERRTKSVATDTSTGEQWLTLGATDQDVSTMSMLFGRLTAVWFHSSKLSFQPGIEYQRTEGSGDRIDERRHVTDAAVFLSAEWRPHERVGIRPGVRAILNSSYDAPAAIPALLAKFGLGPRSDLRLSYAYGFRAPTLRELYFSFHDANHNIDGNPLLEAEYSNSLLASFTWRSGESGGVGFSASATGFHSNFRDRISLVQSVDDPSRYLYTNAKKYKTVGGTIRGGVVYKNLNADAAVSLVGRYNEYTDSHDLPRFRYSPEVSVSAGYGLEKTRFNLFYKFTGRRKEYYLDPLSGEFGLRGMESFNKLDITVNHDLGKYFTLGAGIRNIFDVTTIENDTPGEGPHQAEGGVSVAGYGRSFFLSLRGCFKFAPLALFASGRRFSRPPHSP